MSTGVNGLRWQRYGCGGAEHENYKKRERAKRSAVVIKKVKANKPRGNGTGTEW